MTGIPLISPGKCRIPGHQKCKIHQPHVRPACVESPLVLPQQTKRTPARLTDFDEKRNENAEPHPAPLMGRGFQAQIVKATVGQRTLRDSIQWRKGQGILSAFNASRNPIPNLHACEEAQETKYKPKWAVKRDESPPPRRPRIVTFNLENTKFAKTITNDFLSEIKNEIAERRWEVEEECDEPPVVEETTVVVEVTEVVKHVEEEDAEEEDEDDEGYFDAVDPDEEDQAPEELESGGEEQGLGSETQNENASDEERDASLTEEDEKEKECETQENEESQETGKGEDAREQQESECESQEVPGENLQGASNEARTEEESSEDGTNVASEARDIDVNEPIEDHAEETDKGECSDETDELDAGSLESEQDETDTRDEICECKGVVNAPCMSFEEEEGEASDVESTGSTAMNSEATVLADKERIAIDNKTDEKQESRGTSRAREVYELIESVQDEINQEQE